MQRDENAAEPRAMRWAPPLAALAAVLLSPFAFRVLLSSHRASGFSSDDLRGFSSDVAIALLVLGAVYWLWRRSRVLGAALVCLWCVGQYVNYEIVSALGSLASLVDAHFLARPAFLFGSALAVSEPLLLTVVGVASLALAAFGIPRLAARTVWLGVVGAGLLIAAHVASPWSYEVAAWRQTHFLQHDAARLIRRLAAPAGAPAQFRDAPTAMLDLMPTLASDLTGAPLFPLDGRKRNVLLVILESVSGLHMKSLSQDHGVAIPSIMPRLDAIARESLSYSTFFVHQRRTNKGLYSILCGELPNLKDALPKMSAYAESGRVCLPEALANAGYHTVYLQAAPLAFMLKDRFMRRAGFREVHGDEWFTGGYARTAWGADDRAFLEQSTAMIRDLQTRDEPWFLAMLTVGTHHPYVVPADYKPRMPSPIARSLSYADEAVGAFDRKLDEMGVLEDTLVLYTSDESVGFDGKIQKLDQMIVKGWGFLIARTPERLRRRVREPFAQMDLATSILDYLGIDDRGGHFFGRSVFRSYDRPRHIFFANSNSDFNAVLHPDGHLAMCLLDFQNCRAYSIPGGRVFGRQRTQIAWDPDVDGILEKMAIRSVAETRSASDSQKFSLMGTPRFALKGRRFAVVHGGQYINLDEGDWIEIELEVEAVGKGTIELAHHLQYPKNRPYEKVVRLRGGTTLHWRYTFSPGEAIPDLDARSKARVIAGSGLALHFKTAELTLHQSGAPAAPGLHVEQLEIIE